MKIKIPTPKAEWFDYETPLYYAFFFCGVVPFGIIYGPLAIIQMLGIVGLIISFVVQSKVLHPRRMKKIEDDFKESFEKLKAP